MSNIEEELKLAAFIREIDGDNKMGASQLVKKILDWQVAREKGGEAVAWRVSHPEQDWRVYDKYPGWAHGDFSIQPLYTHPAPSVPEPFGTESAHQAAKNRPMGSNMNISCALVTELIEALRFTTPQPADGWQPKPNKPGRYVVRGFDSSGTEALVCVAYDDDQLVCNLHDSNSDPLHKFSNLMSEISDKFEWLELQPNPPEHKERSDGL